MRSPAAAFAWEFRHRHRWYLIALAAYLLTLGLMKPLFLAPDHVVRFDPPDGFAAFGVVPFSVTFFYLIAVFTFGLTGDVAARQSIYPPRLFTLPVSSAALAGWPMLYGIAAMTVLWLIAVTLARWPWGVELPLLWPGLMTAVVLAWLQVFAWMPYGLRGIRVAFAVIVLTSLNAMVMTAIELKIPQAALVAFLAPQLPIAYLCAWVAVSRARRGHVPDWSFSFARQGAPDQLRPRPPFRSTAAAQFWFEWRRHGRSLPVLVGLVVPFELSVLFISGYGSKWFVFEVLTFVLLTPILMAAFASATVSKANPFAREVYGVPPFAATRPLTTAAMIAAKLKMATVSTIAAWLVLLAAMAIGFAWSGADSVLIDWADSFVRRIGIWRATVAALIVLGWLISVTWTMLVQGLFIGLTGRQWLVRTIGTATLVFFMAIGPAYEWLAASAAARSWLWNWWQLFPLALAVLKFVAAIWVARRLVRSRLVTDRVLLIGAASWMLAVLMLHAVLVWWVDMPYTPPHLLLLIAILAVPLVRVSAAPLALDWNRHR
jgi:hypothetical protein